MSACFSAVKERIILVSVVCVKMKFEVRILLHFIDLLQFCLRCYVSKGQFSGHTNEFLHAEVTGWGITLATMASNHSNKMVNMLSFFKFRFQFWQTLHNC